ncbi:Heme oxygenase [Calycomorphotria hydatis]|uniref:Heme oxygenase n=2 Tax=Calycomorphotria hydatis TaxID=2528027 RepID=A0A517T449_9PLAN|nr:Heme oxygenase [Calycomorphotria hydatis]
MTSLRDDLRATTSPLHQELDIAVAGSSPFDSPENYAAYLKNMDQLYAAFGADCDTVSRMFELPVITVELRRDIEADLLSVGHKINEEVHRTNSRLSDQLADNVARQVGHSYVMEGSALGARYMFKRVEAKSNSGMSFRFLKSLAEGASARWPTYVAGLSKLQIPPDDAVAGACEVFQYAIQLFNSQGPSTKAPS